MSRKSPGAESLKLLYVRSGNECAFSDCVHPIFNDDGLYIAQLCHIEAANKGGPRYNADQSDEERRGLLNLLFMCHRHHKETDDEIKYPTLRLTEIKHSHESQYTEKGKEFSKQMLSQIISESKYYWDGLSNRHYDNMDLKMERDFSSSILDLIDELEVTLERIEGYCDRCLESDDSENMDKDMKELFDKAGLDIKELSSVPYYENPFQNRNWEFHHIDKPNWFQSSLLNLYQLRIKVCEELLKNSPEDALLKEKVITYRMGFENDYGNAFYVD